MRESRDNPKYKRIVLKLSGEALAGPRGYGIDLDVVRVIAEEIRDAVSYTHLKVVELLTPSCLFLKVCSKTRLPNL